MPDKGVPRVLVVGKDARTDAMLAALRKSPRRLWVLTCSEFESPGLVDKSDRFQMVEHLTDNTWVTELAATEQADLAVIGPEEPLAAGLVDELAGLGIPSFGPTKSLARIESSKSWARELIEKYSIPGNPEHRVFWSESGLRDYLVELDDFVIKPDGLTGGKGVKVTGEHLQSIDEALEYALSMIHDRDPLIVEEKLDGEEFSLQTITDGETVIHCPLVQDHKRADDGDQGPNTGGMGSYSCSDFSLPFLDDQDVETAQQINENVINALRSETGEPYRGVLYGGFMATQDGVRIIEYNARFGDPEAMNVLSILEGDFYELALEVASGRLDKSGIAFKPHATVCVYVVPKHYPGSNENFNDPISISESATSRIGTNVYWAATNRFEDGIVRLTGSRALGCVGVGDDLEQARHRAVECASEVDGPVRFRNDIGTVDRIQERIDHMDRLRGRAALVT